VLFKRRTPQQPEVSLNWHVKFIAELAQLLHPDVYVELGIYQGELLNEIAAHVGRAIGIDVDPACARYVRKAPNVRFVCGTTDSFADELRKLGLLIDMLFIDANHSRESVLRDFTNYFPFIRPHGLILIHDTHPGDAHLVEPGWCGDAYRAVEELQLHAGDYEMMTIPQSPGLTLCRKRTAQLRWMEPTGNAR
jgi:predicted O-methyltransferase YrrM